MRTLHLIRHGPAVVDLDRESSEWELTPEAEQPVAALAVRLRHVGLKRLISSHHVKAIQTAEILSRVLDLPVETRPGLEEHHRTKAHLFGSNEQFEQAMRAFFEQPDDIVLGIESASTASRRFHRAVQDLMAETTGDELIVSHGAVMALLLSNHGNCTATAIWRDLKQPDYLKVAWPDLRRIAN